jgi:hypothetical protein
MSPNGGNSFGSFGKVENFQPNIISPITTEFSKGSVPGSISTVNRESAWARWRRGYELATASTYDKDYSYRFNYQLPVPEGTPSSATNPNPVVSGVFVGYPTTNRELGMHWALWRYAGSTRTDKLTDPISSDTLSIQYITSDSQNWYVKLAGNWSAANPLPPPFYSAVPGQATGLKPLDSEILEDRIIEENGDIITANTIDPATQKRYGYVQAVLVNTDPFSGILTVKKAGSIYISPDKEYITPSPVPFTVGRFLITGARFACSCQDFTHREYSFMLDVAAATGTKKFYPRTSIASVKPGRFETTTQAVLSTPILFDAITASASSVTVSTSVPPLLNSFVYVEGTIGGIADGVFQVLAVNPGVSFRYEVLVNAGTGSILNPGVTKIFQATEVVSNAAMTTNEVNKTTTVYAPQGFTPPISTSINNVTLVNSNRDNPGIYRDFGATYLRSQNTISSQGSTAEGMPTYNDYSSVQDQITSLTDNWTPLLDEMRYCKHIYALKFKDGVFPPEPSDFPLGMGSMVEWEQHLVDSTEGEQKEAYAFSIARRALSTMDVPPYNCQSPSLAPILQKLFNVPTAYIEVKDFTMFDKNGNAFTP